MVEGGWGMVDHDVYGLVVFVVVGVEIDGLFPQHELLACSQ